MRLIIERRLAHEAREHLPVQTILVRLVIGDAAPLQPLLTLQFALIGVAEGVGADLVPPTCARLFAPNPRKMSPMPQIAKLRMIKPIRIAMMVRPIQPCAEARSDLSMGGMLFGGLKRGGQAFTNWPRTIRRSRAPCNAAPGSK